MSSYWKKKLDELNEQNAKSTSVTSKATKTTKSNDYWGSKLTELENANKKKKEDEDEIAPVLSTPKKEKDDGLDFFQKGAFDDGYQIGDISKTILGTVGDVGVGVVKGVSKLGEGVLDASRYGVAAINDALGDDRYAEKLRKKAQRNAVDDFFASTDERLSKYSVLGRTSDSIMEGLGQIGGIILTGGLGAAAGGAVGATAATTGLMGVSSFGSGTSEAYQGGATDEEAATYGLIKGVVDAGSEMIFGGLGKAVKAVGLSKGLSSLDDVFARKLADKITSQTAKNFVEYGVKASAEGVEEVLAGIGSAVGKKLTYMDEAELSALAADENLLEQFVVGAVTSGVAQSGLVPGMKSGSLAEANKTGRDFITGNTVNEQKVIDKEYENRIAEQEQDGRKLTKQEKSKIYDTVVSDMEKGYISTDTIEEVLGGDTYKSYKDTVDSEDALQNEFDTLNKMKQGDMTGEQIDRRAELKEQLVEIKNANKRSQMQSQLRDEVFGLVKGDRLVESYNERARKGQAFEADLTKYDAKQQTVIQKAVESGILNNTNRTHEFVDMIAKISADKGVLFDFTNNEKLKGTSFAVDGKTVNGFVNENGVTLNIDSAKSMNSVVGHEITHVLEGTDLYDVLQKTIVDYAKSKGDYQGRYDTISRLYADQKGTNIDAELTADLVGDYLFTDSDFIHNLSTNHRNVFQKIYDEIKYLCKVATAGSKEARELEKVKRAFEKAYKEGGKKQSDTKYSVSDGNYDREFALDLFTKYAKEHPGMLKEEAYALNDMTDDMDIVRAVEQLDAKTASDAEIRAIGDKLLDFYDQNDEPFTWYGIDLNRADSLNEQRYKDEDSIIPALRSKYQMLADLIPTDANGEMNFRGWVRTEGENILNEGATNYWYGEKIPEENRAKVMELVKDAIDLENRLKDVQEPKAKYSLSDSDGNPIDSARISDNEIDTKYSLSHNPEIAKGQSDYVLNKKSYITAEELEKAQEVTNAMVDVMMKYSSILPEDKIGKVLTKNGSYDRSVENTTTCVRTLAYNEFVDKVQEEIGRPLTQMESFLVSQKLYDIAVEPQCLYCYVSLDRKAFNDMLLRYMQDRDTVIAKYNNSDKSPAAIDALYEEFLHGRKPTKEMKSRFDAWISYVDNGTQLLSLADIATEDRQSVIKANGGNLAEQLKDARKYAQSASWSKIQKNYVAYRDEILKLGDRVVKNLNEHYGLRWYSFSDYSAAFIVENMQQITDASIRGLKGLAYTKDTDFAEIFAPSGMNINVSVFVNQDKDGNFFIDEKQSANFEKALELRERYPNVGIVATVTNDDALRWAGSQEWSDVIIPFHIVRTGTDVAEYYKWLNYTAESADTIKDKDIWNSYLDSLNLKSDNARKKVSKNIYPNEHKNDKATYLNLCESRGLSPRFVRFAGEDWYMKLVNETRLSADASSPLKPVYNEDAAKQSFQKFVNKGGYEGGWYNEGVDVDAEARAVADDVLAGKKANEVNYGRQDGFNPESLIANRKTNRTHGRYSLGNDNDRQTFGNYNVYGEDIALETEPTVSEMERVQDAAPVATSKMETTTEDSTVVEDIAPVAAERVVNDTASISEPYEAIRPKREKQPKMVRVDSKDTAAGEKQRKWVKTSTESEVVDGKILPDDLEQTAIHYQPIANKVTLSKANSRLDGMGYESSVAYFNSQFANKSVSLEDVALGERLIQEAIKRGDTKTAGELIQNVSVLGTELGQKVQALSIIKRLTPEGQLKMLQKTVERGKTKGDKSFNGVEITQDMIDHILKTYGTDGTYDQNELNQAVEDVKKQIADQMKVTALDKVNAWRYLSMLGNPKTHIRNLVSNVAMRGTMDVKNAVARTVESIAPISNRTRTWKAASEEVKSYAKKTALEMKDEISGESRYSESAGIKQKRQIFKNKVLNAVYEFNSDMLGKEDWWFSKVAFTSSLSEYLTANGIRTEQDMKNNPAVMEKAKQYALEQSQIATFRQYSWLANKINEIEHRNAATNIAVGAIVPFKKTPINIAKTGLSYSPLGFAKTLTYDLSKMKNGDMEASEVVDHLAQNVTGSALALVGYMLAQSGLLNGAGDDDKEGEYDYQLGKQAYSVNFGGATYSLSWLSPVAMPLFVGVNAYEQLVEGKEWNGDVVVETLAQTLDPLSEMSFISSLDSVLSSYDSGIQKFAGIGETMAQNYITQFAPTLMSQVATVMDDSKRSTKVAGDSEFKFVDQTLNKLKYKIPGLRETLEPTTDIWGNDVKQTESLFTRAFETFLAPYAKRESVASAVDEEIRALYAETGDTGLIPSIPYNYVSFGGEKYKMSAEEYTSFKQTYGQLAFNMMEELFDTDTYQTADAADRAKMVNRVYDYARDEARKEYFDSMGVDFTNATEEGEKVYKADSIKGAIDNDMMLDEYTFYAKNPEKYEFFMDNGISYEDYSNADEDGKRAYSWAYDNPGKFTMSKAISDDFMEYYKCKTDLGNLKGDDNDGDGRSDPGTKKEKVLDYINGLDLDYGQKIILYRSMYDSKDDKARYNMDIVDYLNSRSDISGEDMETILKELGFEVDSKGNISW